MCDRSLPALRRGASWFDDFVDEAEFLRALHVDEFVLVHESLQLCAVGAGALHHEVQGARGLVLQLCCELLQVLRPVGVRESVSWEVGLVDEKLRVLVTLAFASREKDKARHGCGVAFDGRCDGLASST